MILIKFGRIAQLALVATLFTGLTSMAMAEDTLKIGVLGPLTGPGAAWGRGLEGGVRIASKEVNDRGGLQVDGKRYKIDVISYDDQYQAAAAVTAAHRLFGPDQVKFMFGPIGSASMLALKPITERQKIVAFASAWSAEVLKNSKYIFRPGPTTQEFAASTVDWLKKNRPAVKRVALLTVNDETGWDSQRILKGAYGKAGYEVVAAEYFERTQNDYRALLTKIISRNPDSIELDTAPPRTAGLIMRQAREQGYQGSFTKFGAFDVGEIVRAAGKEYAEGLVGLMLADPKSETWQHLKSEYKDIYKNDMSDYVILYYDAANMLFSAMEKAGTFDADKVSAQLEKNVPFQGSVGKLTLGGKEAYGVAHQIYRSVVLMEIKNGSGEIQGEVELK